MDAGGGDGTRSGRSAGGGTASAAPAAAQFSAAAQGVPPPVTPLQAPPPAPMAPVARMALPGGHPLQPAAQGLGLRLPLDRPPPQLSRGSVFAFTDAAGADMEHRRRSLLLP